MWYANLVGRREGREKKGKKAEVWKSGRERVKEL